MNNTESSTDNSGEAARSREPVGSTAVLCRERLEALKLRAYERQAAEVAEMLNTAGVPQWVEFLIGGDRFPSNSNVERLRWYLARRKDVKPGEIDQDLQRDMVKAERAAHEYCKRHNVEVSDSAPSGGPISPSV